MKIRYRGPLSTRIAFVLTAIVLAGCDKPLTDVFGGTPASPAPTTRRIPAPLRLMPAATTPSMSLP